MEALKFSPAQLVAALPRLVGYVPAGYVVVVGCDDEHHVQMTASIPAEALRGDEYAGTMSTLLRGMENGRARGVTECLVVGWRGNGPVRIETADVTAILALDGMGASACLTDGRYVQGIEDGARRERVASTVGPVRAVGADPAPTRAEAVARWTPAGAVQVPTDSPEPGEGWAAWELVATGQAAPGDVATAAAFLRDVHQRDQVLVALSGSNLAGLPLNDQAHALARHQDDPNLPERLRAALVQLAPGPDTLPTLVLVGWVIYARGGTAAPYFAEQIAALDPERTYTLGRLLLAAHTVVLDPNALRPQR